MAAAPASLSGQRLVFTVADGYRFFALTVRAAIACRAGLGRLLQVRASRDNKSEHASGHSFQMSLLVHAKSV